MPLLRHLGQIIVIVDIIMVDLVVNRHAVAVPTLLFHLTHFDVLEPTVMIHHGRWRLHVAISAISSHIFSTDIIVARWPTLIVVSGPLLFNQSAVPLEVRIIDVIDHYVPRTIVDRSPLIFFLGQLRFLVRPKGDQRKTGVGPVPELLNNVLHGQVAVVSSFE